MPIRAPREPGGDPRIREDDFAFVAKGWCAGNISYRYFSTFPQYCHVQACQTKQMPSCPHIYILTNRPRGTLYTGVTSNLPQRIHQHREQKKGFTSRYGLTFLVYYELHVSMHEAIRREKAIKKWNRAWKLELIESINPGWVDLSPRVAA